jgi:hypothetical protein
VAEVHEVLTGPYPSPRSRYWEQFFPCLAMLSPLAVYLHPRFPVNLVSVLFSYIYILSTVSNNEDKMGVFWQIDCTFLSWYHSSRGARGRTECL